MREHVQQFLEHLTSERQLASNTVVAYRNDLSQFTRYLERRSAVDGNGALSGEVPREVVLGFVLSLKEESGYSSATVARKIAAVKSFCHYLHRQGTLSIDPTAQLGTPEVKKALPRAISVDQVQVLLHYAERGDPPDGLRDRAMLRLLYSTGMRVTELVSLNVEDVDLGEGLVRCVGRAARIRTIPVDSGAVAALQEYLGQARGLIGRHHPEERALFLNHRGQRLTRQGFWLIMKLLARQAGIGEAITPHMLRHSFATHRLHDGVALQQIKEILGHANISTTQIYAHVVVEDPATSAPVRALQPQRAHASGR